MAIDFRNRPPEPEFLAYFQPERTWKMGQKTGARKQSPAFVKQDTDLWRQELKDAGITKVVANGRSSPEIKAGGITFLESRIPNERVADLQQKYDGILVGLGAVDVSGKSHDPAEETRRCIKELGLHGIFLEPQRAILGYPDDERIFPVYEECLELDVPVVVMTGPYAGPEIEMTNPEHIDRLANAFPSLKIVCGHGCYPYVTEIIAVAFKHRNVYVSPDMYTFLPGGQLYIDAANGFMREQLLFGSAYPLRPMLDTLEDYKAFKWRSDEVLEDVLHRNAESVLNLA